MLAQAEQTVGLTEFPNSLWTSGVERRGRNGADLQMLNSSIEVSESSICICAHFHRREGESAYITLLRCFNHDHCSTGQDTGLDLLVEQENSPSPSISMCGFINEAIIRSGRFVQVGVTWSNAAWLECLVSNCIGLPFVVRACTGK